ncbi:uncharacterized protein LOC143474687 isoform X2 [Brachyhypopomus gauderio]
METREKEAPPNPALAEWNRGSAPGGPGSPDEDDPGMVDLDQGLMEDDGATLLKRKPSRLSLRWSRKSSRRAKPDHPSVGAETRADGPADRSQDAEGERPAGTGPDGGAPECLLAHFSLREEADDHALILEMKQRQGGEEEERRDGETEERVHGQKMKVAKRSTFRSYRKGLDRAVRRGWETFVANLYSVTLTPVSSSSSSSSSSPSKSANKKAALVDYR